MEFTEEFFAEIQRLYSQLEDQDKQIIREFLHNSEASKVLREALGPQYEEVVRMVRKPEEAPRGLGTQI